MLLMKVVLLIWYSSDFWFQEDWVIFGLKNWLWNLKMPYFCLLRLKLSYKIWTNPFSMFIRVQKCIEFHLPHYEISQRWSHYCRSWRKLLKKCLWDFHTYLKKYSSFWTLIVFTNVKGFTGYGRSLSQKTSLS